MPSKEYKTALFIFRRDLRLPDNTALNAALRRSEKVIMVFNFDPSQVGAKNKYRSENAIQFMIESLKELEKECKKHKGRLYLFYGNTLKTISHIITKTKADALFINYDYTPFSQKRDRAIEALCKKKKIAFYGFHDLLLIGDPDSIKTGSNKPYAIYTPFLKRTSEKKVPTPERLAKGSFYTSPIAKSKTSAIYKKVLKIENPNIKVHGGRSNSVKILRTIKTKQKKYNKNRNFPALDATTHLSASHKFGTISIRESYHAIKKALGTRTQLIKELYWRDFYTYVAYHTPSVFGHPYKSKYKNLWWSKSKSKFKRWCAGTTGFPIVDAGMHQLNTTGWMHNRVRMIVASFLTKDLHISWQWGEKYFAQQLVDYDPSVNNGSWQWAASTGCDAQSYFRIFNPWLQQKKFDSKCAYIKKWIPILKNVEPKIINNWEKKSEIFEIEGYHDPMINHSQERETTLKLFRKMQ